MHNYIFSNSISTPFNPQFSVFWDSSKNSTQSQGSLYFCFDGELPSASASKYALTNIENRLQTNKESLFSIIPLEEKPKLEKKEKRESLLGNMITHIL